MSLAALEAGVRRELELTAHPRLAWMRPRSCGGAAVLDVLVVGAGQGGLAVGFGLQRDRVDNILLVDAAPYGLEGPWSTYARMPSLRSAKDQTGPDLGVPGLTYQAWHEAQWGAADFAAMSLVPTGHWAAYLLWFRAVVRLPVRNDVAVTGITPCRTDDDLPCLRAALSTGEILFARKIVLATGQDGTGAWWMPDFVTALPQRFRAHACEMIDFAGAGGEGGGGAGCGGVGIRQCGDGAGGGGDRASVLSPGVADDHPALSLADLCRVHEAFGRYAG